MYSEHRTLPASRRHMTNDEERLYNTLFNIIGLHGNHSEEDRNKLFDQYFNTLEEKSSGNTPSKNLLLTFYSLLQHFAMPGRSWGTMTSLYNSIGASLLEHYTEGMLNNELIRNNIRHSVMALNIKAFVQEEIKKAATKALNGPEQQLLGASISPLSFYHALLLLQKNLSNGRSDNEYWTMAQLLQKATMPDFLADIFIYLKTDPSKKYSGLLQELHHNSFVWTILSHLSMVMDQRGWCTEEFISTLLKNTRNLQELPDESKRDKDNRESRKNALNYILLDLMSHEDKLCWLADQKNMVDLLTLPTGQLTLLYGMEFDLKALNEVIQQQEPRIDADLPPPIVPSIIPSTQNPERNPPIADSVVNPLAAPSTTDPVEHAVDSAPSAPVLRNNTQPRLRKLNDGRSGSAPVSYRLTRPESSSTPLLWAIPLILASVFAGFFLSMVYPFYSPVILMGTLLTLTVILGVFFARTQGAIQPIPTAAQRPYEQENSTESCPENQPAALFSTQVPQQTRFLSRRPGLQ